jgi:hypothetical protein
MDPTVPLESLASALDDANRARLRAFETGHQADHVVADYLVSRIGLVVATNELAERAKRRLEK